MLCDYDIDGIVIDFERRGSPARNDLWGYLPQMIDDFNSKFNRSGKPDSSDPKWQAYRAEYLGKFMRELKNIAHKRKRPAGVTAIFPAQKELTAHYNIPRWINEKIIDEIGLISHGKSWGASSSKLAELKRKYSNYNVPVSAILYSLQGTEQEIKANFKKAVAGGAKDIVWFETTYLYFKNNYSIPRDAACPCKVKISSSEYDLSKGGRIFVTAAGKWCLKIDNEIVGKGDADKVYELGIPEFVGRKRLSFECELLEDSDKAGIAVQGMIGNRKIQSNSSWTSPQGEVLTLAQPGVPPFLAPLDTAVKGGIR
jgi:hypothetical protein